MYSKSDIDAVKSEALLHELTPAKGRGVYVCPGCGRPRVYNPTAAGIWYCQRCQAKGDVFTAVRLRDGVTHEQAFADVMARYSHAKAVNSLPARPRVTPTQTAQGKQALDSWRAECRRYLLAAAEALPGSAGEAYMQGRGFTSETLRRFGIGYDAKAKVHGALRFGRPAVVYPYSRRLDYYAARFLKPIADTDGSVTKAMKPPAGYAGGEPLFNAGALYFGFETAFVCEGAFDAMALMQGASQVGAKVGAVALCGTGSGRLIEQLTAKPTAVKLLLALDADEAGKAGAVALAARLDAIGQQYEVMDVDACFATCKDPCELLQMDAGIMGEAVEFMLNEPAARL